VLSTELEHNRCHEPGLPRPIRLAAFAPSPVYYRSGLYRRIAADERFEFTAIFSSSAGVRPGDLGYSHPVAFDADALAGFKSLFLARSSVTESRGSFFSLFDVDIIPILIRERFDLVWLHGYYSATHLMASLTQMTRGRKLLIREEQNLLSPRPAWKKALKQTLLRSLFTRSIGMYIGTQNREWFRSHGMPDTRLFHVPFCVDNDALQGEAQRLAGRKRELRDEFAIPPDAGPVILSVARLVPKKQPLLLLESFLALRERHPCFLLVVGTGECEEEMRAFVRRHRVRDIRMVGFLNQSEVGRAYAAADIFVLPSGWDETWGLVVNEAMNFSLPVVVSDRVGSAADLVVHGETGFVFRHNSPQELTNVLSLLVDDAPQRRALGEGGAARITSWNYGAAAEGLCRAARAAVGESRWLEAQTRVHLLPGCG
jgi:glycosyltransferase involved in cell wall biosynthesis